MNKNLQSQSNQRLKGVSIEKSIIYGTVANYLGKKANDEQTHSWTCYVRGDDSHKDVSYFVKKVIFQLHPSFNNPIRVIHSHPFEVTETGWGEFEIIITVYFADSVEKPVEIYHPLKLYSGIEGAVPSTKEPIISEGRDVIVFNQPKEQFYNKLIKYGHHPNSGGASEQAEVKKIEEAQVKVKQEIKKMLDMYETAEVEFNVLRQQLTSLEIEQSMKDDMEIETK